MFPFLFLFQLHNCLKIWICLRATTTLTTEPPTSTTTTNNNNNNTNNANTKPKQTKQKSHTEFQSFRISSKVKVNQDS